MIRPVPPREIRDLSPSSDRIDGAFRCTRDIKKLSNIICVSLLTQEAVAAVVEIVVVGLYYLVSLLLLHRGSGTVGLTALTDSGTLQGELLMCLTYFSYMFIPFILMVFVLKQNPFHIVPVRKKVNRSFILPAMAVVLTFSFLSDLATQYIQLFLGFLHLQASSPDFTAPGSIPAFAVFFFQICILAPLCEEFIFRGVILHALKPFGSAFAVAVSAVLFSMIHGNLLQMPLALLVGLVFGVLVIESGSIWLTVIMHATVNTVSVVIDRLDTLYGDTLANTVYLTLILIAVAASVFLFIRLRRRIDLRARFESFKKSVLPNQFLFKKFASTPGFIIFALFTVGLVVYYIRII